MQGIIVVNEGCEEAAKIEIKQLIGKDAKIERCVLTFDIEDVKELAKLAYMGHTFSRVGLLLGQSTTEEKDKLKEIEFGKYITAGESFAVRPLRKESSYMLEELGEMFGEIVYESLAEPRVDLKNPDCMILAIIVLDKIYMALDFCGFDIGKRPYKIFNIAQSLSGPVAATTLFYAGFDPKEVTADLFCKCGTLSIEAALYASGTSAHYYQKDAFIMDKTKFIRNKLGECEEYFKELDKDIKKKIEGTIYAIDPLARNVEISKKNAKIAGILSHLEFSKVAIDWMDTKFKKHTVDKIITYPPEMANDKKKLKKIYEELFYQAEYILKPDGKLVLLLADIDMIEDAAKKHKFEKAEERGIFQGKKHFSLLTFKHEKS